MRSEHELEFASADDSYGLVLGIQPLRDVLRHCQGAGRMETGGILVGQYDGDMKRAIVVAVSGPPADSFLGCFSFVRGVRGLQRWLDARWRRNEGFYLGEWHFHPYASPSPSTVDIEQMRRISQSRHYCCPEPILVIIGGDPTGEWSVRSYVFPRNAESLELLPRCSPAAPGPAKEP